MKKKKKLRLKKKIYLISLLFLVLIISSFLVYSYYKEDMLKKEEIRIAKKIKDIKSHYNDVVVVDKKSKIYKKENDQYTEIGSVEANKLLKLDKVNINQNIEYFKVSDLDYYIPYNKVKPSKEKISINDRYKKYIVFNENIKTKDNFKLYNGDKLVYTINKSIDTPVIKKSDYGAYIEYYNELYFVNKKDIEKTYEKNNTDSVEATSIPVTCNHFIYLEGDTSCNEIICHSEKQIREEFNYLKENNYFTMTTTELRDWLEGKIRLPEKSLLITIDDGARAWNFIPLLEEYKLNATLFLITGWYDLDRFQSPYMELASHTHDLHTGGKCPGGQGSGLKCLDKKLLLEDLAKSREKLHGTEAFCYPFYEFNDYSESVLKEAGFKIAFIGGQKKVTKGVNPYQIPRISFSSGTTLEEYINYVKP